MKLVRLVEMIRKDISGAEGWPVYFASFQQNAAGEWHEVEDVRKPITAVEVEEPDEILLITDSDGLPLTLARLEEELAQLMPRLNEYTVDCCETPIVLNDGETFHIDFPVVGAGRDEANCCYLVVFASTVAE